MAAWRRVTPTIRKAPTIQMNDVEHDKFSRLHFNKSRIGYWRRITIFESTAGNTLAYHEMEFVWSQSRYLNWESSLLSILEDRFTVDFKESESHEIECLLWNHNSTTDIKAISAQLSPLPYNRSMNYQTNASSSTAPSSIYATETDSISPLISHDIKLQPGRSAVIPVYRPDPSGVKDPNEIVMVSVPIVPSESACDDATQ